MLLMMRAQMIFPTWKTFSKLGAEARMDGWTHGWVGGQIIGGWMDGQMDGWIGEVEAQGWGLSRVAFLWVSALSL